MSHDSPPMETLAKATVENQLADLLEELTVVQDELLEVLASKRERIAENDMAGAADLQSRTESLCDRLQACHERRAELLEVSSGPAGRSKTLGELAKSLDSESSGKLVKQVNEASARTRLLQHHSLTNWVLAQRSIIHLAQLLEIIATGGQLKPTYESGTSPHTESGGSLVDQEA